MTELISLSCNHCGAPLSVSKASRFVMCSHCNSSLAIKSSGDTAYTEVLNVLAEIEQDNEKLATNMDHLRCEHELDRLNREWDDRKKKLSGPNSHKRWALGFIGGGSVALINCVFMIHSAMNDKLSTEEFNGGILFACMGVPMICIGLLLMQAYKKMYRHDYADYQRERDRLSKNLNRR